MAPSQPQINWTSKSVSFVSPNDDRGQHSTRKEDAGAILNAWLARGGACLSSGRVHPARRTLLGHTEEEGWREGSLQAIQGCTEILIDQIRLGAEFRIMNEQPRDHAVFGIDSGARNRSRVGMKSGILAESDRRATLR